MKIVCYKINNEYGCGYLSDKTAEIGSLFLGGLKSLNNFVLNLSQSDLSNYQSVNKFEVQIRYKIDLKKPPLLVNKRALSI